MKICPKYSENGAWYADSNTVSVRPSVKGDAINLRFNSYSEAVMYLVWNAMLGCKLARDHRHTAEQRMRDSDQECVARCYELERAMRLMEQMP